MDLFGDGEKENERFEELESRLESLESHLEAVDSALQDFTDDYSRILEEELDYQEQELEALRKRVEASETKELENRVLELERRLSNLETDFDQVVGLDLEESLSDVVDEIKGVRRFMNSMRKRVSEAEEKVEDVENELMIEINNRDYDFENKVDERRFEEENDEIREELKKLRASVNFLADELDSKEEIELD